MYSFFAYLNRMKYINRWSLMRNTINENIMEHSQQVAVVAHCLAVVGNVYFNCNHNADRIASLALFHESGEVITGDLPTPIKYYNPELNQAYKQLESLAEDKLIGMLPKEMQKYYIELIKSHDAEQYKIVKYADKLCAYIKCIEELKVGNNEYKQAKNTILSDLTKLNSKEVNYFLDNFLEPYSKSLDELGVTL